MARIGLGAAWSCAFANDFDPVKAAAYRANFADADQHLCVGDVWALEAADLPRRERAAFSEKEPPKVPETEASDCCSKIAAERITAKTICI